MMTLDAADREVCVVHRQTTATPLQALVLLNDPQFVEAARAAAENVLNVHDSLEASIATLFRVFTGRVPNAAEQRVFAELYADQLLAFKDSSQGAKEFLEVGDHRPTNAVDAMELAAMTVVAQTIMNHYDTVTKQ